MINFSKFFSHGFRNTLKLLNGVNFSYKGPWVQVYPNTVIDEWYVGEFMSAEYTISVDYGTFEKEIIKCLIVAAPSSANLVVYGRVSTNGDDLINITADVNNSKVTLYASPAIGQDSTVYSGSKLIFSANYYYTINELSV